MCFALKLELHHEMYAVCAGTPITCHCHQVWPICSVDRSLFNWKAVVKFPRCRVKDSHDHTCFQEIHVLACTQWSGCVPIKIDALLLVTAEEVERIKRTVGGWDLDFDKILGGALLYAACAQGHHQATSSHTGPDMQLIAGWYGRVVPSGGKAAVLSSADRIVGLLRNTSKRHWNS